VLLLRSTTKKQCCKSFFHSNVRDVRSIPHFCVVEILSMVFEISDAALKTAEASDLLALFLIATGFQLTTKMCVREGRIQPFVFCMCIHIILQFDFLTLYKKVKEADKLDFNISFGRYRFSMLVAVDADTAPVYTGIQHRASGRDVPFPFTMQLKKTDVMDGSVRLAGDGSSKTCQLLTKNAGNFPVSSWFQEATFEEAMYLH